MRRAMLRTLGAIALTFLTACRARSQTQTLNLWPGVAPGSEKWTHKEKTVDDT
jgi:hypothetical protein